MDPIIFVNIIPTPLSSHIFPIFLSLVEKQNYDKSRIIMHFDVRFSDDMYEYIKTWIKDNKYQRIIISKTDANGIAVVRNRSMDIFDTTKAEYYISVNSDCFLVNPGTFHTLVSKKVDFISPMIECYPDNNQSNFFPGVTDNGYYSHNKNYDHIKSRKIKGLLEVPLSHVIYSASRRVISECKIRYDETEEYDFITFARNLRRSGIKLHLINEDKYAISFSRIGNNLDVDRERSLILSKLQEYYKYPELDINKDDKEIIEILLKHLESDDLRSLVDLSSGEGHYSIMMARQCYAARIYSYEKDEKKKSKFLENIKTNMVYNISFDFDPSKFNDFKFERKVKFLRLGTFRMNDDVRRFIEYHHPMLLYKTGSLSEDDVEFCRRVGYFPAVAIGENDMFLIPY